MSTFLVNYQKLNTKISNLAISFLFLCIIIWVSIKSEWNNWQVSWPLLHLLPNHFFHLQYRLRRLSNHFLLASILTLSSWSLWLVLHISSLVIVANKLFAKVLLIFHQTVDTWLKFNICPKYLLRFAVDCAVWQVGRRQRINLVFSHLSKIFLNKWPHKFL